MLALRHFIEEAYGQAGSLYGRRMYEIMRYRTPGPGPV
ncbi:hypothetical protein M2281_003896 [Mesorhizobium soli]|nr:hypothetical protein [Mesorhizobium soli]